MTAFKDYHTLKIFSTWLPDTLNIKKRMANVWQNGKKRMANVWQNGKKRMANVWQNG